MVLVLMCLVFLIGYEINALLTDYIGIIGTSFLLFLLAMLYLTIRLNLKLEHIKKLTSIFKRKQKIVNDEIEDSLNLEKVVEVNIEDKVINQDTADDVSKKLPTEIPKTKEDIKVEVGKIIEDSIYFLLVWLIYKRSGNWFEILPKVG